MVFQWPFWRLIDGYIADIKEVLTMFVNIGKTDSRHSSSSDAGIGSSARDLGEHFLSRDGSESAVIGLNAVRVEP